MITTEIEIAAPPHVVRDMFFNFPRLADWHNHKWIVSIDIQTPGKTIGNDLLPGDKMLTTMSSMQVLQTVQINTPTEFRTIGPWYGILTGIHSYQWYPSEKTPGGTRMVQSEEFTGLLAWFMRPGMPGGERTRNGFEELNAEVKRSAERLVAEGRL